MLDAFGTKDGTNNGLRVQPRGESMSLTEHKIKIENSEWKYWGHVGTYVLLNNEAAEDSVGTNQHAGNAKSISAIQQLRLTSSGLRVMSESAISENRLCKV